MFRCNMEAFRGKMKLDPLGPGPLGFPSLSLTLVLPASVRLWRWHCGVNMRGKLPDDDSAELSFVTLYQFGKHVECSQCWMSQQ